ncbi:TetR-like C-terminal domain-containing protein [Streptomyces sp. NPDC052236]|uniref:TetR-like C-terminal domain-containing protein n=1 Tax=Streptomyces sp. NPDC052236 TaxID=3365686 RepID=UPI0037D6C991
MADRGRVLTQLEQQARWINQPIAAFVIATVIEQAERDNGVRRIRQDTFGRADEQLREALAAAVERGELRPGVEEHPVGLVCRVLGPLLFQRFMLGIPLEEAMVVRTVDAALALWLPDA